MKNELVIVIDFGGQYNQLVARRVRECNVYCEIYSYKIGIDKIKEMNPKGIILTGGPNSCYEPDSPTYSKELFELGIPVLGLCYGAQLMQHVLGGKVEKAEVSEYGKTEVLIDKKDSKLFENVSEKTICWMSHTDYISQVAPGFEISAHTADCPVATAENADKSLYAIQFHPEVLHTVEGKTMLSNFVLGVCGCAGDWKMDAFVESTIKEIREKVGDGKVLLALSGGVDSSYTVAVSKPNKTFSVGFEEDGFDETELAKSFSEMMNIENKRKYITKREFFDSLPKVEYYTDEPHANLSTVPLLFLSELAGKDVKVVLSGEGSDEMFGGYNEYLEPNIVKMYMMVPSFIRKSMANVARRLPHFPGKNTIIKYSKPFCERYIGHAQVMTEEEANDVLVDRLKDNMTTTDVLKPYYDKVKKEDDVLKKMYIDMNFWLPQDILLKADKMSMAGSVELRVPFLDKEVWDVARKIPTKYLIRNNQTKEIFRSVAAQEMPEDWSSRRKLGFPVPFSKWIKEEEYYLEVKKYFNEDYVSDFFDKKRINELLDNHYYNKENNGRKIYNIYIFLIWYKVYFADNMKIREEL